MQLLFWRLWFELAVVGTASCKATLVSQKTCFVAQPSCAMHTLRVTGDIRKASLWRAHATLQSTEVYFRADPTEKLEAMASLVAPTFLSRLNGVAPALRFRPRSQLRMICLRKITTRRGTERFMRQKPCLTGVAMTSRLAPTGAVAETSENS